MSNRLIQTHTVHQEPSGFFYKERAKKNVGQHCSNTGHPEEHEDYYRVQLWLATSQEVPQ